MATLTIRQGQLDLTCVGTDEFVNTLRDPLKLRMQVGGFWLGWGEVPHRHLVWVGSCAELGMEVGDANVYDDSEIVVEALQAFVDGGLLPLFDLPMQIATRVVRD